MNILNSDMAFKSKFTFVLFFAVLLPFSNLTLAQTKLKLWNIHPEGYPVTVAVNSFAENVNKAAQGRYQIEVFSNGTLGDQPKAVQMIKTGEIDLAEFSNGPLSDAVPGIKVLNLPFLFNDSNHMFRHLDGKLGERFAANLKAAGFVMLGWYDGGSRSFYCIKPIANIGDLAGKKIRVQSSEIYKTLVKELTAEPLPIPFKEVYAAFENGKIDCAENNFPSYESTGHYKVAKHVFVTNHVISPEALVVSTKVWDKLSSEDKVLFQEAGKKSALYMRDLWSKRVAEAIQITAKQGSTFTKLKDPATMIKRMSPLYGKFMNDVTTREELLTIIADQ
jgi:tripartite ATP-independent transporter DctP family solute receptor